MTLLEFLNRAHRWTGGAPIPGLGDPLDALASLVRANPASPRARVVLRVLIALRDKAGEFEQKENSSRRTCGRSMLKHSNCLLH